MEQRALQYAEPPWASQEHPECWHFIDDLLLQATCKRSASNSPGTFSNLREIGLAGIRDALHIDSTWIGSRWHGWPWRRSRGDLGHPLAGSRTMGLPASARLGDIDGAVEAPASHMSARSPPRRRALHCRSRCPNVTV
jgi:hypothetical protein